eukprot:1143723-Pelagomonas_calceolata.AAC.2
MHEASKHAMTPKLTQAICLLYSGTEACKHMYPSLLEFLCYVHDTCIRDCAEDTIFTDCTANIMLEPETSVQRTSTHTSSGLAWMYWMACNTRLVSSTLRPKPRLLMVEYCRGATCSGNSHQVKINCVKGLLDWLIAAHLSASAAQ